MDLHWSYDISPITKTNKFVLIRISILLLILIAVSLSSYTIISGKSFNSKKQTPVPPDPINTVESNPYKNLPIYSLPTGSQIYRFTHGPTVIGPKASKITIDPLTPAKGESQTISIDVAHDYPVTAVKLSITTDYLITDHILSLKSGTNRDGIWSATWINDDTLDYRYAIRPIIASEKDTYDATMWLRNPQ